MNSKFIPRIKNIITIGLSGVFILLIVGVITYTLLLKFKPIVFKDVYGISYSLGQEVFLIQNNHYSKYGRYLNDDELKSSFISKNKDFVVGYFKTMPTEFSAYCPDCVQNNQSYKELIAIKGFLKNSLWVIDNKNNFENVGQTKYWPE